MVNVYKKVQFNCCIMTCAMIEYLSAANMCLFETDMYAVCGKVCMTRGQTNSFCAIWLKNGKIHVWDKNEYGKANLR